jgi:hypothetical protein
MGALTFFIVTFLAVTALYLHSPVGRAVLDRIEINATREEHLLRYKHPIARNAPTRRAR